jgi:hypothetical protein
MPSVAAADTRRQFRFPVNMENPMAEFVQFQQGPNEKDTDDGWVLQGGIWVRKPLPVIPR